MGEGVIAHFSPSTDSNLRAECSVGAGGQGVCHHAESKTSIFLSFFFLFVFLGLFWLGVGGRIYIIQPHVLLEMFFFFFKAWMLSRPQNQTIVI